MIKGFDIEVHYKETEIQNKYINKVLNEKRDTVYAITNIGGLIIDDSKVISLGDTKNFSRKDLCLKT